MITEFEAKFLNVDEQSFKDILIRFGATTSLNKTLMRRQIFDIPSITAEKKWLRIRDEGNKITVTFKQVHDTTRVDGVQELEFVVSSFSKACSLFTLCGLIPLSYQENYRENWHYKKAVISIDTWPGLPTFVEIEALDAPTVFAVAQELGFDCTTGYYDTVAMLYEQAFGIPVHIFNTISRLTFDTFPSILNTLKKQL